MEDLIQKNKVFVKKDKSEEWENFVRNTPNTFPHWTAVMHSIPILKLLSQNDDFPSISLKLEKCSSSPTMREMVLDIVIRFSEKGNEFEDFMSAKQ